jgi:chemotaxis signal transduction protein
MIERAFLPFEIAGQQLLIDALFVREILGEIESVVVPQANRELPGVFLWNSQATALLDLASCLTIQDPHVSKGKNTRTLVVQVEKETVGFCVDDVGEVVKVEESKLGEVRVHSLPFALAEVELDGQISTVLNLPKLVTRVLGIDSEASLR